MLLTAAVVEVITAKLREHRIVRLVVDTVMVGKTGSRLLRADAVEKLRQLLLPLALIVTPNTDEAEVLTARQVRNVDDMKEAARRIHAMGSRNVLIKGGHLDGDATDVFFDGVEFVHLEHERIPTNDTHGTGCVLSSAITAYLARGENVQDAVTMGKTFVTEAIRNGLRIGSGRGPCDPLGLAGYGSR
jgi:hydroxymethylpyrimidine/phosphomethylpyrimidine kinase